MNVSRVDCSSKTLLPTRTGRSLPRDIKRRTVQKETPNARAASLRLNRGDIDVSFLFRRDLMGAGLLDVTLAQAGVMTMPKRPLPVRSYHAKLHLSRFWAHSSNNITWLAYSNLLTRLTALPELAFIHVGRNLGSNRDCWQLISVY